MFRKTLAALALTALTACASTPNPIAAPARQAMFVKDVALAWNAPEPAEAKPEYLAGKQELQERLEKAVEEAFRLSPAGSEPVVFQIDIKRYSRVGAAMGNLIGGSNMVVADVKVVRPDGQVAGVYQDVTGVFASNGGIIGAVVQAASKPEIEGIMANSFAQNLRARFDAK